MLSVTEGTIYCRFWLRVFFLVLAVSTVADASVSVLATVIVRILSAGAEISAPASALAPAPA